MSRKAVYAVFTLLCLLLLPLAALAGEGLSMNTHLKVVNQKNAAEPEIFEDQVIFTSSLKARFIGIAFEHESFNTIHPMRLNQNGVAFLVYPVPISMKAPLRYRMVVDGLWTYDQKNPKKASDALSGIVLSVVDIPFLSDEEPGKYRILDSDGKTAHFRFRAESGELITVAGSFNEWDPFMYEMEETMPGLYELDLEMPAGRQRYAFIAQGKKTADPLNPHSAYTQEGTRVSVLDIP
jgi:hypothetical protein